MTEKTSTLIIAIVMTAFFVGCAMEPPKCSDDKTLSIVLKIIMDQIDGGGEWNEKEVLDNLKIEFPRASAFDEKIKKYSCKAKLIAGDMYQLPISYESQLDDNNQHIVSVGGFSRGDWLRLRIGMIEGIKRTRAESAVAVDPHVPTTTPSPAQPQSTTQTKRVNLPFIGKRSFNFYGGSGTGYTITIKRDGNTTIKQHGTMSSSILYSGEFRNPITLTDGQGWLFKDNKVYSLDKGKIEYGCSVDGAEPCESDLYK